ELWGVAATSPTNAWAVGSYKARVGKRTLILHWNGTAWKRQPNPSPGSTGPYYPELRGVAATSSTNAWAVGSYYNGTAELTLVEHWNGTAWKVQPSPNPGGTGLNNHNFLYGVAATSATNSWAVGSVILHWNGKAWKVQSSRFGFAGVA